MDAKAADQLVRDMAITAQVLLFYIVAVIETLRIRRDKKEEQADDEKRQQERRRYY